MKKLLTLLSLTLSMTAFAAPQENPEKTSNMNINATVIKPLTIEVIEDMNFGKIIQGTSSKATGVYEITGEPGQIVTISTVLPEMLINKIARSTLPIAFAPIAKNNQGLDRSGKLKLDINGTVSPTSETVSGDYTGVVIARVQYQ